MAVTSCYLGAPVEQWFGADLLTVVAYVVQQTAQWHELRHQHHVRSHAHCLQL